MVEEMKIWKGGKGRTDFEQGSKVSFVIDSVLAAGVVEVLLAVVEEKRKEARRGVMGK